MHIDEILTKERTQYISRIVVNPEDTVAKSIHAIALEFHNGDIKRIDIPRPRFGGEKIKEILLLHKIDIAIEQYKEKLARN